VEKKYGALRIISSIYKIIAILGFILAFVGAGFLFFQTYQLGSRDPSQSSTAVLNAVLTAGGFFLASSVSALSIYAVANLIDLLISTEENTRATALLLQRMRRDDQSL
jgi:hypothetical protein